MLDSLYQSDNKVVLVDAISDLLNSLGKGVVDGVAYDTAWVARLAPRYPGYGFEATLEWLRRNQYEDGTWGAPLVHYHDRFISTLAAIVALREVGHDSRDERRVKRGEDALWRLVGRLGRDDSDTVGFPILSASLAEEAATLGLDVPHSPIRFALAYKKKVKTFLEQSDRNWRESTLTFSFEALRFAVQDNDVIFEANRSVSTSPSATAGYLLDHFDEESNLYLKEILDQEGEGAAPALHPINVFEIVWSINHLRLANAIEPDDPKVRELLDYLWQTWSPKVGISYSTHFPVQDVDVTAACFTVLRWAGYPVNADVFEYYEEEDHFSCYRGETNPALSAHVRLLAALRPCEEHPKYKVWTKKILDTLHRFDENGVFWWDKWHSSPYYVNSVALNALYGIADDLAYSRLKWILRTQNDDGGWGYLGESTSEETAYCLEALLIWDRDIKQLDPSILDAAAKYLQSHLRDNRNKPLWIGKSLYTPIMPVKAVILSALFSYTSRGL